MDHQEIFKDRSIEEDTLLLGESYTHYNTIMFRSWSKTGGGMALPGARASCPLEAWRHQA